MITNGNKWIFITIYYLGQFVDVGMCTITAAAVFILREVRRGTHNRMARK